MSAGRFEADELSQAFITLALDDDDLPRFTSTALHNVRLHRHGQYTYEAVNKLSYNEGSLVAQWLGRWIRDREVASLTPGGCVSE